MDNKSLAYPPPLGLEKELSYVGLLARNAAYVSFIPENGYSFPQFAYVDLPNVMIDMRKAFLQFSITGTPGPSATFTRFNFDIRSIIQRITVEFSSRVVVDIQNYNLLCNMLDTLYDVNLPSTVGSISSGMGSAAQRNAAFANPNFQYAIQLYHYDTSFFHSILPLQKMASTVRIKLYFENPANCIESDVAGATYVVNNLQFHYNVLIPDEHFNRQYDARVRSGLTWTYETFTNFQSTNLLTASSNTATQILTYKYNSLLGILMVMRDSSSLNNYTYVNKLNTFNYNNINVFRLRISSQSYPIDQHRTVGDLYYALIETFGISARFPTYGASNYSTTQFVGGVPLSKHPLEERDGADIGGISTVLGTSIFCDLQFNPAISTQQVVDFFSLQHNTITFLPNGAIEWSE